MSGLYNLSKKNNDAERDLKKIRAYGDTMNDNKVQLSFTLPVKNDDKGAECAVRFVKGMGIVDPVVALRKTLDGEFTFYVVYGSASHTVDYAAIKVAAIEQTVLSMEEVNSLIAERIGRKIVVVGASTGTDAHTVGIDAIMNMKGFAGHYGLERYNMISAFNLGSQVGNEDFVKKARELNADVLLVSQTVTQKDVHVQNLVNLIELLEAENERHKYLVCCGGARITNELAKELGYDAGFGSGTYADDVATYIVNQIERLKK